MFAVKLLNGIKWLVTNAALVFRIPKLVLVPYLTVELAFSFVVQMIVAPLFVILIALTEVIVGGVISKVTFLWPAEPMLLLESLA